MIALLTLQLLKLSGLGSFRVKVELADVEVSKETVVVGGSNGEEDLGPAKRRNGVNGSDTVGDFRARKARSNVPRESVDFWDNETDDSKLGNYETEGGRESYGIHVDSKRAHCEFDIPRPCLSSAVRY